MPGFALRYPGSVRIPIHRHSCSWQIVRRKTACHEPRHAGSLLAWARGVSSLVPIVRSRAIAFQQPDCARVVARFTVFRESTNSEYGGAVSALEGDRAKVRCERHSFQSAAPT